MLACLLYSCLSAARLMLRLQRLRAILQSTLNHQSHVKYSCWNKVPAHNTLTTLTGRRLTVRTEEAELGELRSSLVQTDVEGLTLGLRVSVVTSSHLASAAEQGGRHSGQGRVVSPSYPGYSSHSLLLGQPRNNQEDRHSCNISALSRASLAD